MASGQDLTNTICEDFLTCKICFNTYDKPKILPCVHTYCSSCIEKLLENSDRSGSITCPECRERVTLPHGLVSDLKTNFLINGLVDVVKVKNVSDVKCTTCSLRGKDLSAKSRCLDCGDYLCSSCSDGHNASSRTWNHKKVLLEDIRKGSYDKELRNLNRLTCSQHHEKEIEYFCETCQTPMCLACVLVSHHDHKCITATEAVTAQKNKLVNHVVKVKEKLELLKTEKKKACENLENLKTIQSEKIRNTEKIVDAVIAKIETRRKQSILELQKKMGKKLEQSQSLLENTEKKITLANDCLEFCETMINQGKNEEMLYLEETISKRLQQLENVPSVEIPSNKGDTEEEAAFVNDFQNTMQQIDTLFSGSDSSKAVCPALQDQTKDIKKVVFKLLRVFDTECETDKKLPDVKGIAIRKNIIFVADNANKKVKCITTQGVLQKCLEVDEDFSPFAVAVCEDVIAVVHRNFLFFFKENGKRIQKVEFTSKPKEWSGVRFTFALANYRNEGFIVGNLPDNHFRVFSKDGKLLKRFVVGLRSPLANISIDHNGNLITCEWGDNSVKVRTGLGEIITNFQLSSSWKPNAANSDRNGFIYAVNSFRALISVFDQYGNIKLSHATKPDGLLNPVNLVFDGDGLMYVVSESGQINTYEVKVVSD